MNTQTLNPAVMIKAAVITLSLIINILLSFICSILIMFLLLTLLSSFLLPISCLSYNISTTWNGYPVRHIPTQVDISSTPTGDLTISITARLFLSLSPPPGCVAGKPYPGLWNYEVIII